MGAVIVVAKRAMDLIGASLGLLVFAVPMLVIAGVVRLRLGSPVLFRQKRPGLGGQPFTLYKFRTMRDAVDDCGRQLPDERRLEGVGILLRSFSLDELPTLWNVIRGDMSLVGPRPLLLEYLALYTDRQSRRHEVRPGVTGWAQVNGRNAISWKQKLELDLWYVDNSSILLDLKILWLTVFRVFRREGVSQMGQATVERFNGKN